MKTLLLCGALLVLTGPALVSGLITVDHHCRSNQTCVFYGALGRPLYLQLPDEYELQLRKIINETSSVIIFHFKNQKIRVNPPDPRWQFNTENKIMIITKAEKEDSGRYRLQIFNSTGKSTGVYNLQLIIEAVVSSVKVTDSCISIGNRKVYCSSDGDQIQFNWTLNGIPHDQNMTDGNKTLLLDYTYTGNVTCNVKNHVSSGSDTVKIEHCPGSTTAAQTTEQGTSVTSRSPNGTNTTVPISVTTKHNSNTENLLYLTLIVLGSFTVLLIVVSVIACHIYRKKQAPKNTGSPQNGEELLYVQVNHKPKPKDGGDRTNTPARAQEEEVEYASVVRKSMQKKKKKEQKEEEVQYGEVVFKTPAKQRQGQAEEECVYSQVQHKR